MDVINEIVVLEEDVKDVHEKCKRVNCSALYDAMMATFKLLYDLIFMCCKKHKSIKNLFNKNLNFVKISKLEQKIKNMFS